MISGNVARRQCGVTLVEILIALVVLAVGIVALAGGSGLVSRMLGHGKVETHAAEVASQRMEQLRRAAASTTPRCTAPDFRSGGPVIGSGLTESWVVPPSGQVRQVRVTVSYLTVRGARTAALETRIEC
jgi:prepilin-type N-terminal cleavage/methylation domain-containing protein